MVPTEYPNKRGYKTTHVWLNGNICVIDLEPYNVIICGKNTHTPSRFADIKAYPQVKNDRGRWKMHKTRVYAN